MSEAKDPVAAYQEALEARERARRGAKPWLEFAKAALEALGAWPHVMVTMGGAMAAGPRERQPNIKRLEAEGWPTAENVIALVEAYWRTEADVQDAWAALPAERKIALIEPDRYRAD